MGNMAVNSQGARTRLLYSFDLVSPTCTRAVRYMLLNIFPCQGVKVQGCMRLIDNAGELISRSTISRFIRPGWAVPIYPRRLRLHQTVSGIAVLSSSERWGGGEREREGGNAAVEQAGRQTGNVSLNDEKE